MATNYPTSLDTFTNPSSGASLSSPSHAGQHGDINDAVEAIEAKLGIGASAASSAAEGAVLKANGSGSTTYAKNGLWHVNTTSFSAVSTVQLNNCFSSTYRNYRVLFRVSSLSSSATRLMYLQVVDGTTVETGAVYSYSAYLAGLGAATIDGSIGSYSQTSMTLGNCYYNDFPFMLDVDVFEPQTTNRTTFLGTVAATTAAANQAGTFYGQVMNSTQYEGLYFTCGTGTMTGFVAVYGYQN
jgi:hypothetical protein